jgi:hypothetical protein
MSNLAYWKACVIDAQRAAKQFPVDEFIQAVRFAKRKVEKLERIAFKAKGIK